MHWYDCPMCGLKNSSDGEHYCGKCEERYQREESDRIAIEEEERLKLARRGWIHGTSEEVEVVSSIWPDRMQIRRAEKIEWVRILWAEPAEIPGGGLIFELAPGFV